MQWLAAQLFTVPLCKPAHKTKSSVYIYIYLIHHQPYQLPDLPKSSQTFVHTWKVPMGMLGLKVTARILGLSVLNLKKKKKSSCLVQDVSSKAIAAISCAPYPQVLFWVLVWQPQSDVPVHRQQPSLRDKPFPMEWEKKLAFHNCPLLPIPACGEFQQTPAKHVSPAQNQTPSSFPALLHSNLNFSTALLLLDYAKVLSRQFL